MSTLLIVFMHVLDAEAWWKLDIFAPLFFKTVSTSELKLSAFLIWAFHFSDLSGVRTQHYNYMHDTDQEFGSFFWGEPRKTNFP